MTFKILLPAGRKRITVVQAAPGKLFTESFVEDAIEHFAADVEREFPLLEFRLAQIGPGQFNFVSVPPKGSAPDAFCN